jgi:hypothetical protein
MPASVVTRMRFNEYGILNNAGNTAAGKRWAPTNLYDVDPVLGSTAIPGFTEMSGLYRVARLNWSSAQVKFTNAEANLIMVVGLMPINYDPGPNPSASVCQSFLSNPLCKTVQLGLASGMGSGSLRSRASTAQFAGSPVINVADSYATSTTASTNPNNWWWLLFASANVGTFINGIGYTISFDLEIRFSELANPAT